MERARESEENSINMKIFNDSIHGHIEVHPLLVKIIDTPEFQRLRNIKQLGGAYWVYPGASHNRFEHSIGVAYLAGCLINSLQEKQPELNITDRDKLCVQIAGLSRDLGHGPFSKMFEKRFIPEVLNVPEGSDKHSELTIDMFNYMIENNGLKAEMERYGMKPDEDCPTIENMIKGVFQSSEAGDKAFLYEITENKWNGVDVNKFDYFARDCHHLGISKSFDHQRLLTFARVCEVNRKNHICFSDKEADNIYEMFRTHYNLHRQAYQHKTVSIIEIMMKDAFIKANEVLHFSDLNNMEKYSKLTDYKFEEILNSTNEKLEAARTILKDVMNRRLPKYVGEGRLPEINDDPKDKKALQKKLEVSWKKQVEMWTDRNEIGLRNEFKIDVVEMDHGMKNKNPLSKIYFYYKEDPKNATRIDNYQVSSFLPKHFHERLVRVYYQKSSVEIEQNSEEESSELENAKQCFKQWGKKRFGLPGCITFFERSDFNGERYTCVSDCQGLQNNLNSCHSIRVDNGTWVLYKNQEIVDLQHILKREYYRSLKLWERSNTPGQSTDTWSCKIQTHIIILYSQENCVGDWDVITDDKHLPVDHFKVLSCEVFIGSWMLSCDDIDDGYILHEGRHNFDVWKDTVPNVKSLTYIPDTV